MNYNLLLVWITYPVLVSCSQCPDFQAVIPLRPSVNQPYSLAVVADGHYYLMTTESDVNDWSKQEISLTGSMPHGFNETRVITVIDRFDCNESQYYLIAIQSFPKNFNQLVTLYTKYDLLNESDGWSEPESIATLPLFSKDEKLMSILDYLELPINEVIRTLIYWDKTKTLFVLNQKMSKNRSFKYYSVNLIESCRHNYYYSRPEDLKLAIPSNRPLDLCLIVEVDSESILYCLSENSVQIDIIDKEFQNGTLRSHESTRESESSLSVDQFEPLRLVCNVTELSMNMDSNNSDVESVGNKTDRKLIRIGQMADILCYFSKVLTSEPLNPKPDVLSTEKSIVVVSEEKSQMSPIWVVVFVILILVLVFSLIVIAFIAVTDSSRQQLARM